MSLEKFIEDFEEAVEDIEPGSLTGDTRFKSLKSWDSLAVLSATDTVEMEYGVLLRKEDFAACDTLCDLYGVVSKRGGF